MKTKIIYISGNELFDIADIRAAFEEVRAALSLDNDTILFGVPVDKEDALDAPQPATEEIKPVIVDDIKPIDEPVEIPESRTPRKRAKVVPISAATEKAEESAEPAHVEPVSPVVPILSVLGSKSEEAQQEEDEPIDIEPELDEVEPEPVPEPESVSITDMIADEVPDVESEKTLEELLESMTPLGEDAEQHNEPITNIHDEPDVAPIQDEEVKNNDDIDMTLEKLATEFVESQDKLETPSKPATRGKIGKLKNILPFKKAKHDDSGLMGDLFGWAGVAANDEEFTIPGFFTNAASKK